MSIIWLSAFIIVHVSETARPAVYLRLGAYAHTDYERHTSIRPDVTQFTGPLANHAPLHRIANQFYYRTKGIADYLAREHGPDSTDITLIIGDHLPPILNESVRYTLDKQQNVALLYHGPQRIDIEGFFSWQLPGLMVSLARGETPHSMSKEDADRYYHYLMQQATASPDVHY